ncbi:MAG: tetratricopeptide repeat protein [Myxococcota bacterium]
MSDRIDRDPPRLKREVGPVANLLRNADAEWRNGLDEPRAFERLESVRRRRALVSYGAPAVLIAGVALFAAAQRSSNSREPASIELRAELPRKAAPPRVEEAVVQTAENVVSTTRPATAFKAQRAVVRSVTSSVAVASPPSEADCKQLAAAGKLERARDCFRNLARSASGIEAEVALYESARLAAEALHEPARAIGLLDEHASRFPSGALRGEVAWLKIRSLAQVGRFDAALRESETLLGSPEGRALTEELHLLRGHIYQNQHKDCVRALSEFVALVGTPGARGDEAEFSRARCLETLGRVEDAVLAYERYLERSNVTRAPEARARLTLLRP